MTEDELRQIKSAIEVTKVHPYLAAEWDLKWIPALVEEVEWLKDVARTSEAKLLAVTNCGNCSPMPSAACGGGDAMTWILPTMLPSGDYSGVSSSSGTYQILAAVNALQKEVASLRALLSAPSRPVHALTLNQAAARLGCSKHTIHELLKQRRLVRAPRIGREGRVTLASVEAVEARPKR